METYYECGICTAYHRWKFDGDCRENGARFYDLPDDAEVRTMEERIEADLAVFTRPQTDPNQE